MTIIMQWYIKRKRRKEPSFAYLLAYLSSFAEIQRKAFAEFDLHLQQLRSACFYSFVAPVVGIYVLYTVIVIICDTEFEGFNGLLIVSLPIKKFYGKVSNLKRHQTV